MITTILCMATGEQLLAARLHTSDHLHLPIAEVTLPVAVAYVNAHFHQGSYEAWEGFAEMLAADSQPTG